MENQEGINHETSLFILQRRNEHQYAGKQDAAGCQQSRSPHRGGGVPGR